MLKRKRPPEPPGMGEGPPPITRVRLVLSSDDEGEPEPPPLRLQLSSDDDDEPASPPPLQLSSNEDDKMEGVEETNNPTTLLLSAAPTVTRHADPIRIPIERTMTRGADYSHGTMQLPASSRILARFTSPTPGLCPPPRKEQTARTLTPPILQPIAAFIVDKPLWNDPALVAHETLRVDYSKWAFRAAAAMGVHPDATPEQQRAAGVIQATTVAERDQALKGSSRPPPLDTPQLLSGPKAQRSVQVFDAELGVKIHTLSVTSSSNTTQPNPDASESSVPQQKESAKNKQLRQFHRERRAAMLRYYVDHDPEPDPDLPFGLPPTEYKSYGLLIFERLDAFRHRHERLAEAADHLPRVSIELVDRAYLDSYRRHVESFPRWQERRTCCNEKACVVHQLAQHGEQECRPQWGYEPPEFFTPTEETERNVALLGNTPEAEKWRTRPVGPCWECTRYNYTQRVLLGELHRKPPLHPINRVKVKCCPGEYGIEVLIPEEQYGVRTGIEGHVPYYDKGKLQFDPQPGDTAILREVNVDFHMSLNQMNAVLGVRKSRPLATHATSRFLPLKQESMLVLDEETEAMDDPNAVGAPGLGTWPAFVNTLPPMLFSDRAFVQAAAQSTITRVPALWLRLLLLHGNARLTEGAAYALLERVPDSVSSRLVSLFKRSSLAGILITLADAALAPFEHSFNFIQETAWDNPLLSVPLQLLLIPTTFQWPWLEKNFYLQHGDKLPRPPRDREHLLYTTCLWRIAVSVLLEAVLIEPWPRHEARPEWRLRTTRQQWHYYRCVHLDFLTVYATRLKRALAVRDMYWLTPQGERGEPPLTHLYPQLCRIACAEELPDMAPLLHSTNQWCDMSSKKQNTSMRHVLAQIYLKAGPHVCMMRGIAEIVEHAMETYPAIQDLITLVIRCGLLGTLGPRSEGRPSVIAMMRINATFAPLAALLERVTPEQEKAQGQRIRLWVRSHPMLTLSFIREHFIYVCESNGVFDDVFGMSRHWAMFKAVVRQTNVQVRRQVSAWLHEFENGQVCFHNPGPWVPWHVLEKRIDFRTSKGEIVKWHEKGKDHNTKLFKDTDYGIMLRKMHIEKRHAFTAEQIADIRAWLAEYDRFEAIHVAAWTAAHATHFPLEEPGLGNGKMRPAVPTGILKLLGMSGYAFNIVREWKHESDEYHTADDNFITKVSMRLYENDIRDYVLLKLYLRLYEYYTDDLPGFLSIEQWRAQMLTLRGNLSMHLYVEPPIPLGRTCYCEGCNKWAHPVVRPSREYLGMPMVIEKDDASEHNPLESVKKKKKPRPWPARDLGIGDGRAFCMTDMSLNPLTLTKHCVRGHVDANKEETLLVAAEAKLARERGELDSSSDSVSTSTDESEEEEEEEEEDDDESEDNTPPQPGLGAVRQARGKKAEGEVEDISRLLLADYFHCRKPLSMIDLTAVVKRLAHRLYSRCVYCGRVCEMLSANQTNLGLSCGEHALPLEYPLYHRIWRHIQRPPHNPGSACAHMPKRCCKCWQFDSQEMLTLWEHDARYKLRQVTLCKHHAHEAKARLWRTMFGEQPVPIEWRKLKQQLNRVG